MMEFTNFVDVNAVVLAAPTVVLVIFALAAAWMNRVPRRGKTVNPEASEERPTSPELPLRSGGGRIVSPRLPVASTRELIALAKRATVRAL